jgi:hypothetical protein
MEDLSEPTREQYETWMSELDEARRSSDFRDALAADLCPFCEQHTLCVQRDGDLLILSCGSCFLSPRPSS